jgi:hypothetical protein
MKTLPRVLGMLAAITVTASISPRAHACWDGYSASVRRVSVNAADDAAWSPERARALARWGARIDALLPTGTMVDSEFGFVTVCKTGKDGQCGATVAEIKWEDGQLATLFSRVAAATRATPATVKRARAVDAAPLTLQVFAGHGKVGAQAFASRINDAGAGANGFYTAGGFPASNPTAHVVSGVDASGRVLYRVVVGAFLAKSEALATAAELKTATGIGGFVRAL